MRRRSSWSHYVGVALLALALLSLGIRISAAQAGEQAALLAAVQEQGRLRVIVGIDAPFRADGSLSAVEAQAQQAGIAQAQNALLASLPGYDPASVQTFQYIPYLALTVDEAGLQALLASGQVTAVYEDGLMELFMENSATLVGAENAWTMGYDGSGQTVAVIDTGINKAHWFMAGKVVAEACFSTTGTVEGTQLTTTCPNGQQQQIGTGAGVNCNVTQIPNCFHGTHVAGTVAGRGTDLSGMARDADLIAINVASRVSTILGPSVSINFSDMISAMEHVYDLRNTFEIAAVNMSLGTPQVYNDVCDADYPAEQAAANLLRSAGIAVIAASGNGDPNTGVGYSNGISMPACLSATISVGAVSADPGVTDRIGSFSNSSGQLDLYAPGLSIDSATPGGALANSSGTSMAAPHVAGAWAVLKDAAPNESIDDVLQALKDTGIPITDSRNGLVRSRIQIDAAITELTATAAPAPPNDSTTGAQIMNGLSFFAQLHTRSATNSSGLPAACATIGSDVWYRFESAAAQSIVLDTLASSFDTVIAVWTGIGGSPALVGCNDDAVGTRSRLTLDAQPGVTYFIQVGGKNGASGSLQFGAALGMMHDEIASARIVGPGLYRDRLNTDSAGAAGDPRPPCIAGIFNFDPLNSVWYRYTATGNDRIRFETAGSDFNTLLAVYTGAPGSLTHVACHDDVFFDFLAPEEFWNLTSVVDLQVTAGTTYTILASGKEAIFTNDPSGELVFTVRRLRWTAPQPPAVPSLISPANGAALTNTQPTLSWNAVSGATSYDVQLDTVNPPANTIIPVGTTSYTPAAPLTPGTYYWRVRTHSPGGTSTWSGARRFSIEIASGDVPQRNRFATLTPTLTWNPLTWADEYQLEIAEESRFLAPLYTSDPLTDLEHIVPGGELTPGAYFFRVRARETGGAWGPWSAPEPFVVIGP